MPGLTLAPALFPYALPFQTNTGGKEGLYGFLVAPSSFPVSLAQQLMLTQAHYSSVEWDWNPPGLL